VALPYRHKRRDLLLESPVEEMVVELHAKPSTQPL
jgi:hypothetical protein